MRAAVALLGWILLPGPARAAGEVDNPHGSFQAECRTCHAPDSWAQARVGREFDHAQYGYALDGAHRGAPCLLCHLTLEFTEVAGTACAECHQDVHAGELGAECERCHTTRSFIDRTDEVRSHRLTRFPLTGAHRMTDCESCHRRSGPTGMTFANLPTDCGACHLGEFRATVNPDHQAAGFPTDCSTCHSTQGWEGSDFNHALTGFALTGAHRTVDCQSCHGDLRFTGASPECFACHEGAYRTAADPDHAGGGFPTQCADCHSTSGWSPAGFDHSLSAFPLTGAHAVTECMQCHGDGVYAGKDPACVACHLGDYQSTANPVHSTSGFGTDCAACHGTNGWLGATVDHAAFFPIDSGAHRGEWGGDCTTCHTQPSSFQVFTCLPCHDHRRSEMDAKHQGERDYSYDSNACYSCHPRGKS
jgi:Zn finger protein HypA/HybF involved in hydrogenase expression